MKPLCIIVLAIALLCAIDAHAQHVDADKVATAIERQMQAYPESSLLDIYKSFFQDVFGPGHIIASRDAAMSYLKSELEQADTIPSAAEAMEPVGWRGNYVRVDLALVKSGRISADMLIDALIESADSSTTTNIDSWRKEWTEIEAITRKLHPNLPNLEEELAALAEALSAGRYVSHHSRLYNRLYHPHYRLIRSDLIPTLTL